LVLFDLLLGVVAVVAGAALLLAAAPFYLITAGMYWIAKESAAWPTVPGTIYESAVRSNRRANGLPGHRYRVRYTYEWITRNTIRSSSRPPHFLTVVRRGRRAASRGIPWAIR
jgi:hypothetical protein